MNFHNFHHKTEARLKDAILSLWATGDAEMQRQLLALFAKEDERLLATPVFQTAFPWEPATQTFAETDGIFNKAFIAALDKIKQETYRFPADRHPYKHQVESWQTLLQDKKSIAVTTGTGSGKTECFMLPVLYDIFANCRNQQGVNAIFLYPLNALIGSQKKRMHAWCDALGGIKYAVYNGDTPDQRASAKEEQRRYPELISRTQIRQMPPQILFTNPSMLEYVLVRNKDVPFLQNSKGKLRWILLDEAHTLTGSRAAEMALLIRRIIDAFEADVSQLRFAITSATVGAGEDSTKRLTAFMADLCGIEKTNIKIITGHRVLSQSLPIPTQSSCSFGDLVNHPSPENIGDVQRLRENLLEETGGLSATQIQKRFGTPDVANALKLVDALSERNVEGKSLLPVRGHFFARGIGGLYACTNPKCDENKTASPFGRLSTHAAVACRCGWPMLEMVTCSSCGNYLMEADRVFKNGNEELRMVSKAVQDPFAIDKAEDEEDESSNSRHSRFYFAKGKAAENYVLGHQHFSLDAESKKHNNGQGYVCATERDGQTPCVHCGEKVERPFHFRLSSSFINRILADILLEETPAEKDRRPGMLWEGRKYISFTDSRQGTARISALINQDKEASWVRSTVYHLLCQRQQEMEPARPSQTQDELRSEIKELEAELSSTSKPAVRRAIEADINRLKADLDGRGATSAPARLGWEKVVEELLLRKSDLETLFDGNNPHDKNLNGKKLYLSAILYDQFARRLPKERSLENLGMVSLVYPALEKAALPAVAEALGITTGEWQNLLKIAVDYVVRVPFHFVLNDDILPYTTSLLRSGALQNPDGQNPDAKPWPTLTRRKLIVNRLALLICAGLGYHELDSLDATTIDQINELMGSIWRALRSHLLFEDNQTFKLRLEEKAHFQLSQNLWLCPVKRRLLDVHFRNYSPWIKGRLTAENIRHYYITQAVQMPVLPHPFHLDEEQVAQVERTRNWMETASLSLRRLGVWNNLHEQVVLRQPVYLAGEHSAQQRKTRLEDLVRKFEAAEVNVLNCSTTMEMGVDIGGISAVVMNNVPPAAANYLQRAGRAGRRSEAKSLALTICAPNPIGMNAMLNPQWALNHPIAPPILSFRSNAVAERHVHAFFLGKFVQLNEVKGLNIRETIQAFFFSEGESLAFRFGEWMRNLDVQQFHEALHRLVAGTPLASESDHQLLYQTSRAFEALTAKTVDRKTSLEEKISSLEEQFGDKSPAVVAVGFQLKQFINSNAVQYLAEECFLPSAGMPTGVVELETVTIDDIKAKRKSEEITRPSYFITQALSEFAPGNEVVIDGRTYSPAGVVLQNERNDQAKHDHVQRCECGNERIVAVADDLKHDPCPHCGQRSFKGLQLEGGNATYTELIEPVGFAVDLYKSPNRRVNPVSGVQYVDPLLMNVQPWPKDSPALYECRESDGGGEILFYNKGNGAGYFVCLHCGRTADTRDGLDNHKRLRGGKSEDNDRNAVCSGNNSSYAIRENVILGGRFKTDFCELRLRNANGQLSDDETLLYTLGSVFTKRLTRYLGIEEGELNFGLKRYQSFSTIFIYDNVRGGAGYAVQFPLYADRLFKEAKEKLECDCEKACTKCLIDRHTQWHMDKLDRHTAVEWLEHALNLSAPAELKNEFPGIEPLVGSLQNELARLSYTRQIKKLWVYAGANVKDWEPENIKFFDSVKQPSTIDVLLEDKQHAWNTDERVRVIQLQNQFDFYQCPPSERQTLQPICVLKNNDGQCTEYLTAQPHLTLDGNWGNPEYGFVYKRPCKPLGHTTPLTVTLDRQTTVVRYIDQNDPYIISSNGLGDILLRKLAGELDLAAAMKGQRFDAVYSDRYLKTPIGCLMMVQFLDVLQNRLGFSLQSFLFKGKHFGADYATSYGSNDFRNADLRNRTIERWVKELGIDKVEARSERIPHYRFFKFWNDKVTVTIWPDGGVEHGWYPINASSEIKVESVSIKDLFQVSRKDGRMLYSINVERN